MTQPLHVLIVEDSENDTLLLCRELEKGGFDPQWQRVDTEAAMRNHLQSQDWDLILSDYSMPRFSGLEALRTYKESGLDIPFIIISGAIGEETAVTTMKAGAHDYVLKDRLSRLIPAIQRELKEAAVRRDKRLEEESRRRLEHELRQAKELAEIANQRKSRVLAFVAHELKNPIKAVQSFADVLKNGKTYGPLNEGQLELVQAISTACRHIRGLMDDILDIAPIEAGQIELQYENVDLATLLDEVRLILSEPAKQRNITFSFYIEPGLGLLRIDPKRVRQIFINLLSNAIKYTHADDTVKITAIKTATGVEVQVEDHGPGIPENELKCLFMEYYRVKNTLSRQNEGLGLGLALVKKLVELHQGDIQVESSVGQGTVFKLFFPALPDAQVTTLQLEQLSV